MALKQIKTKELTDATITTSIKPITISSLDFLPFRDEQLLSADGTAGALRVSILSPRIVLITNFIAPTACRSSARCSAPSYHQARLRHAARPLGPERRTQHVLSVPSHISTGSPNFGHLLSYSYSRRTFHLR